MLVTETPGAAPAAPAAATPPPAAPAATPPAAATPDAWEAFTKGLPDDLRNDSSLSTIKSPESLVKSYIAAQKMVGNKVSLPDPKHATHDDYLALFKKMGAVEKPEDFKFKLPDGVTEDKLDPAIMGRLKEAAVKAGVLPWQFENIFGAYHGAISEQVTRNTEEANQQHEADISGLKKEWGAAFDTHVRKANVVFKELVPDAGDRERLINDGIGAHPVVMKMLINASKFMKEDTFLGQGAGEFSGYSPESALQKARSIQGDSSHPYRNPMHPNHEAAKKEVQDLYKVAFPE